MISKLDQFNQSQLKKDLPDIRPGDTVRVHQKISAEGASQRLVSLGPRPASGGKEEGKERIQIFEGVVLAKKHGKGISATITVRKVIAGVGVERIFPIHSPSIAQIEVLQRGKTKRAKLYYLRTAKGKRARLKREEFAQAIAEPVSKPEQAFQEITPENTEQK